MVSGVLKLIDHINAFALALLSAIPLINVSLGSAPAALKVLPIFLLVGIAFFLIVRRKVRSFSSGELFYIICVIGYISILLLSTWWVSHRVYYVDDLLNLTTILIVFLSVYISFNLRSAKYFLKWIIFIGVCATFFLFQSYISAGSLRGYDISDQYLVISQAIGAGAIVCFTGALTLFHKTKFYLILSIILFVGIALSLARGALLSTIFISSITSFLYLKANKKKSYSINEWIKNNAKTVIGIGVIILLVGGVIFVAFQVERTAGRLIRMFSGNELAAGGRGELWKNSLEGISESPLLGFGFGSSGLISGMEEGYYPHNLFLQSWLDGGFFAFLFLSLICWFPFFKAYEFYKLIDKKNIKWIPFISFYLFLFLEYSKSTDFYEARMFFIVGLISVIVTFRIKKYASSFN